jgi:hypothetical protein
MKFSPGFEGCKQIVAILANADEVANLHLDIGTAHGNAITHVKAKKKLYCEASKELILEVPGPCFFGNALDLAEYFPSKYFDLITALDVIEHQIKEDGIRLLETIDALATGRIVMSVPFGPDGIGKDPRKYQTHLSVWFPEEFFRFGYQCVVYPHYHPHCGYFFAVKDMRYNYILPDVLSEEGIFKGGYYANTKEKEV